MVYNEEKNMEYIDVAPRSVSILTGRELSEEEKKLKAATQAKNMTSVSELKADTAKAGTENRKSKRSQKR